jgi:Fic family protein
VLISDFSSSQREHVARAERGYLAFVPPPLPAPVALTPGLVHQLSAAGWALGALAGASQSLPNLHLISQLFARREAVLSSRIEGTQATLSQLALFEADRPSGAADDDVREVYNYLDALHHVLDPDRRYPLSLPLLLEAHKILLAGVRGGHATPGEFRRTQNWIGPPGSVIDTATFVPPPPEQLWDCLDAFEKYLHAEHQLPPLLEIATLHYQFEAIHPFLDGNGRVGRLLVTLLMVEWGLLPGPLLDLSAYIEPRRDRYYQTLLRVSTHGEWLPYLDFFLEAVENQARDAIVRAVRLHDLRQRLRIGAVTARSSAAIPVLIDALFETPAITINKAMRLLGVTHRAASANIERLVTMGILEEMPAQGRTRLFLAPEILRLAEGPLG